MHARSLVLVLVCSALAVPAFAQDTAPAPIENNSWTLEYFQGAVVGSSRVLGLGGAYTGVAQGVEGLLYNPASVANRPPTSADYFDWDFSFDTAGLEPGSEDTDFFNAGPRLEVEYQDNSTLIGGIGTKHGRLGLGLQVQQQKVMFQGSTLEAQEFKLAVAWAFRKDELLAGFALRGVSLKLVDQGELLSGLSYELGALWRPNHQPWRVGAGIRTESRGTPEGVQPENATVQAQLGERWLPNTLVAPAALSLGGSWTWGPLARVYNRKRREKWKGKSKGGRSLLLAADLVFVLPSDGDGQPVTGMPGFLAQRHAPLKDEIFVSLRVGVELALAPGRLRVRGGFYSEPARSIGASDRGHLTLGFDLKTIKLFGHYPIRLSLVVDGADRYQASFFSIGFWNDWVPDELPE